MRTMYLLIPLLTALPVLVFAQNAPTNNPAPSVSANNPTPLLSTNNLTLTGDARLQQAQPKSVDSDAEFQAIRELANATTVQPPRLVLEGALVRATQAGQPWQVLNPAAPKEFGDGFDNVILDARTERPSGVVLLSIRFGKAGRSRR